MSSIVPGFEYDIFISYRHNDNRSGWVTDFVNALQEELAATIKEPLSIYFDKNPHDGLLETHNVDKSLEGKLKCLIFIPILSQTYCDPKSFAWQHEFCAFNQLAKEDQFGRDIKLSNGNVASRILPIKIHELDDEDKAIIENETGELLRSIEFIFKSLGVNRPLRLNEDHPQDNLNKIFYRDQINKVANTVKELVTRIKNQTQDSQVKPSSSTPASGAKDYKKVKGSFWEEIKQRKIVRVASVYAVSAWVVIQIASTIFPPLNMPAWALTFVVVLVLLGFPVVLIFAWAMEVKHESKIQNTAQTKKSFFISWYAVLAVGLILGLATLIYHKYFHGDKRGESIAVIPFINMSDDPKQEYFSDGMTDEVLTQLSMLSDLKVISRTSSMKFKGAKLTAKEIADQLGVTRILEGSVQKSGTKVKITVQLIDAPTDNHLWSKVYEEELNDVFAVEKKIANEVAKQLDLKLRASAQQSVATVPTQNSEAHEYYLKGRSFWNLRTKESYDSAESYFNKAKKIDPQFALAYSGLADCYTFNTKGLAQSDAIPIARSYALKALQLDSNLCEAITTVGFIQSHFDYDWKRATESLQKAIRCNPNYPIAYAYLSNIKVANSDKSALNEIAKALELDPLSPSLNWIKGRDYYSFHQFELCKTQLINAINLNPKFSLARTIL
ncbi:MAG TPA: hypothetical protein DGG95_18635, partial [Cytophagales bacterium]|nr:hypothetical protein [Cytophagales bacterium]